jgi:uncharacterized lipoprotein
MNKIKKIYRDFFGLNEQAVTTTKVDPKNVIHVKSDVLKKDPKILDTLAKAGKQPEIVTEKDLDEATLDNSITEYQGGVQWIVTDPATAKHVMDDISTWAQKKGFTIIKRKISKSGKVGYIYFRMGEDPAKESQRIQGYISQTPEIHRFRFKVLGQ